MRSSGVNTNLLVEQCALLHVFCKWPGCVLIGSYALIRINNELNKILIICFCGMQTITVWLFKMLASKREKTVANVSISYH